MTTGQTEVTAQDLLNEIRLFEDDFQMMANSKIANAGGKFPLGGGVFTEIILNLLEGNEGPWTIRFEDEGSAHTKVTGGTFLATDSVGASRPVTTNFALTINQSVSGTLVETGVSGLTPDESVQLDEVYTRLNLDTDVDMTHAPDGGISGGAIGITTTTDVDGNVITHRE